MNIAKVGVTPSATKFLPREAVKVELNPSFNLVKCELNNRRRFFTAVVECTLVSECPNKIHYMFNKKARNEVSFSIAGEAKKKIERRLTRKLNPNNAESRGRK